MQLMQRRHNRIGRSLAGLAALTWFVWGSALAANDEATGVTLGSGGSPDTNGRLLSGDELEALVAPVALYPDDLLAIVLPAATFPLQVVQAARYLDAVDADPSLTPDSGWDESVIALLNYPDVVKRLSDDLDWTAELGQATANQQQDVLAAVDRFRRKAYAAGNLESDAYQHVDLAADVVEIRPADPAVIYVPYYEPTQVVVWHSYDVLHYYRRPCPVYYYPYPAGHYLMSGLTHPFWGLTSVFSIGWHSRHLQHLRLEQHGHPYFGYDYAFNHYRYWRPRLLRDGYYRHDATTRHDPRPRREAPGRPFRGQGDHEPHHREAWGQPPEVPARPPARAGDHASGRVAGRGRRETVTAPRYRRATRALSARPATVEPPARSQRRAASPPRTGPRPRAAPRARAATPSGESSSGRAAGREAAERSSNPPTYARGARRAR